MPTLDSAIAHYADMVRPRLIAVPAPSLQPVSRLGRRVAEPGIYETKSFAATGA
jgi:hypothetical protein